MTWLPVLTIVMSVTSIAISIDSFRLSRKAMRNIKRRRLEELE